MFLDLMSIGWGAFGQICDGVNFICDKAIDYATPTFIHEYWYNHAQDYFIYTPEMVELDNSYTPRTSSESSSGSYEDSGSSEEVIVYVDSFGNPIGVGIEDMPTSFTADDIINDLISFGYERAAISDENVNKLMEVRKAMGEQKYRTLMNLRMTGKI